MIQTIIFIIFLVSVLGVGVIVGRKIPVLATLPKNGHHGIKKHKVIVKIENHVKKIHFDLFHKQIYLHKFLSWVKVWTLKTETKIDMLLHQIRKKAQELDKEPKKKKNK